MADHNPTWENTLNTNKSAYFSIDDAANAAHKVGYEFMCWNDRIYVILFDGDFIVDYKDINMTIEDLATTTIPKRHIVVAGRGASGQPVLETYMVAYTKNQEKMGIHYEKAIDMAEDDGMRSPFICFDEAEYGEIHHVAERLNNVK